VTVNLRVIPVVTLWNGHITGESFVSSSRHLSGTQSGIYLSRKMRWLARNEEAVALRKHAAVRHKIN